MLNDNSNLKAIGNQNFYCFIWKSMKK
jgi:hypothetical protein